MRNTALEIDGRSISGPDILTAVAWLTDPRRRAVLGRSDLINSIEIYNSHEVVWNTVTHDRIIKLIEIDEETGKEVAASVLYDNVKSIIVYESYDALRESIFVPPHDREYYIKKGISLPGHIEKIASSNKILYNSVNIDKIIDEYHRNERRLKELKSAHGDLDFRVKQIVEQTVSSRLTSVFFESAEMRARMRRMEEDSFSAQESLRSIDRRLELIMGSLSIKL